MTALCAAWAISVAAIVRALDEGVPSDLDYRIVCSDGSVRIVHGRGEVERDESGKAIRMLGTVHDVSEARRAVEAIQLSEARLRESQRIAHVGSWGLELDGYEAWWTWQASLASRPQERHVTWRAGL